MRSYDFFYIPVLVSMKRSYQHHHNPFIPFPPLPVHPRPLFASLLYSRRYLLFLCSRILDVTLNESSRVRGHVYVVCTLGCSDSDRFFSRLRMTMRGAHVKQITGSFRVISICDSRKWQAQPSKVSSEPSNSPLSGCSRSMLQRCHLYDCQYRPKGKISADR